MAVLDDLDELPVDHLADGGGHGTRRMVRIASVTQPVDHGDQETPVALVDDERVAQGVLAGQRLAGHGPLVPGDRPLLQVSHGATSAP
jgi:hypothetical protein